MEKRLNIGLMISHLEDDFASTVCRGAIQGAKEIDANLIIFPGRYIDAVYVDKKRTEYEYQYNTLFSYAFKEDIDVLLVLIGTIGSGMSYEKKLKFLKSMGDIPIITIACEVEGYPSVCFDNKSGLAGCIEHLIDVHMCRRIGFVSGPKTNGDAIERLEVYKDTLKKHGIPVDEDRIVYGRFSQYSQAVVNELLDRCPDLEAIVFANDAMAGGAYEVFEQRGIEVGKDILVTGFDDAPVAVNLVPTLTTVRADAAELGYGAVIECMNLKESGKLNSRLVRSSMVKRRSCGCNGGSAAADSTSDDVFVFDHCWCRSDSQTVSAISRYLFGSYKSGELLDKVKPAFEDYIKSIFRLLQSDNCGGITLTKEALEHIPADFEDLLTSSDTMKLADHDRLCTVISYLSRRFAAGLKSSEDKFHLENMFIGMYQILMRAVVIYSNKRVDDVEFLTWQSNSITKDMLLFDSYDDQGYGSVTDKLTRLNVASSYIYIFPETITHKKDEEWLPPPRVLLKSYHNADKWEVVPTEEQELSIRNLFNHKYIPTDRRFTMVLSAIFLNADHYGLFLCELEYEYFYYISSLSAQLCAAMKILRLIQDKENIQQELERTLMQIKEKNMQLDEMSKVDVLTGTYNRRGFFTQASSIITSPMNDGRDALIIFADLDSLKTINDTFGHEDGDFAIKNAARILHDSFRSSDVIGRIGGDEFSVLAMVENASSDEIISIVRSRINETTESFNATHTKPYVVHMSVGVYAFKCGKDVELSKILAKADDVLYEEKKKKKSILR
ncbi:MAG: GGDEF domain-containing protein [Oscillospiraceae bacterium]|nr:GGDEF domain-containing protein [Oscillospiraceae bacterium]